jgi:hypothetical protein
LGLAAGIAFILGLAAATFSSADSVLTTLTTSTYIDFLHLESNTKYTELQKKRIRNILHSGFAVMLLVGILIFKELNNQSLITTVLLVAGYTYGPLLGLFSVGILTKLKPGQTGSVLACLAAPVLTFLLSSIPGKYLGGYVFVIEILILNGLITFILHWFAYIFSNRRSELKTG